MLRVESVTSFIEQGLNEVSQEKGINFRFKLFAEFGKSVGHGEVEGVVRSLKGTPTSIKDYEDIDFPFICTLIVSSQISNYSIINVRTILEKFIQDNNGKEMAIDDGVGIFTFTMPSVGDYKIDGGYGGNVPVRFDINVRYTTNSVTASNKHWFLNNIEIPYLSESVLIDKDGITRKINGESYSKTQLTGQVKSYKFVFPYDTRSELCTMLQQDILNGDFEKTYELKYYDGKAFTEEQPFVSTVSIYKNADTSAQPTKTSMFNITFTDVDNGAGSVKYYLALCDTIFDNNSENTRFFEATSTKTAQQVQIEYWESKISCDYEQIKAPNLNSIDITSQVYKNTNNYELFDLTNKNYAIIKVEQNGTPIRYYYYFITNAQIGAQNQVLFDLKLDTIQTYIFNEDLEFSDCLINRAHLNRFKTYGSFNFVRFNSDTDSPLFEREEFYNVPKRLISRQKLSLNTTFSTGVTPNGDPTSPIDKWLDNNVVCWAYVYVDPTPDEAYKINVDVSAPQNNAPAEFLTAKDYRIGADIYSVESNNTGTNSSLPSEMITFCFPIYKTNKTLRLKRGNSDYSVELGYKAYSYFKKYNSSDYIFTVKLSNLPPFSKFSYENHSIDYTIEDNGDLTLCDISWGQNEDYAVKFLNLNAYTICYDSSNYALAEVDCQQPYVESKEVIASPNFSFQTSEIIGAQKNPKFNPKLILEDFYTCKITDETSSGFNYDLLKLGKNRIKVKYYEPLVTYTTKNYITISNLDENGIYIPETNFNFTGAVNSNDYSLIYVSDYYKQVLAQNKNFYEQQNWELAKGIFGSLTNITNPASLPSSLFNTGVQSLQIGLTLDNMKSAPGSLKNAKGNAYFNLISSSFGVFLEEYDMLPNEKEIINNHMDLYGFTYNKVDNIKNVWNIRKYHNYVQANIDAINGVSMSNTARADIKQRFQNGLRFWNSDNIQYSLENYENWLED